LADRCGCGYRHCTADGPHTLICAHCATPIEGRRRKFCTDKCARLRWRECDHCGNAFAWQLSGSSEGAFCSRSCAKRTRATYPPRMCDYCHTPFLPHKSNVEGAQYGKVAGGRYCSRACAGLAATVPCTACKGRGGHLPWCDAQYPRSTVYWADCVECGEPFPANRRGRTVCGTACQYRRHYRIRGLDHQRMRSGIVELSAKCVECGVSFRYWGNPENTQRRRTCGKQCGTKRARRLENRRRRARLRAVERVPYDDLSIFERDGWYCRICSGPTRREARGSVSDPAAPTIDHIVPLSKGGADAPWNVQCAHRGCNARKGNGSAGSQLLLQVAV
jgi:5-methylcytosine-specific restriction endonuclease McrA